MFVYDNKEYKLVSKHEHYDKSRFITVRKVLAEVKGRNSFPGLSEKIIRKGYESCGAIESIELIGRKKAYITFENWRGAYNAVVRPGRIGFWMKIDVRPASVLLQPSSFFVYDDETCKLITKFTDRSRGRFFTVRKVLIKIKDDQSGIDHVRQIFTHLIGFKLSEKTIRKEFQKYGEIESIELLGAEEAYVTFTNWMGAYNAVVRSNNGFWSKFVVKLASTWLQPFTQEHSITTADVHNKDSEESHIHKLNGDCLEKIFEYCDIDACTNLLEVDKWFNNWVSQYGFQHFESFKIDFKEHTLGKTRRILLLIGHRITKLQIDTSKNHEELLNRLQLEDHVGTNLRELDVKLSNIDKLMCWRPLLTRLDSLKIESTSCKKFDMNFQKISPSLSTLVLSNVAKFTMPSKQWPTLKHFALRSPLSPSAFNVQQFCLFLKKNPQLKCVEFEVSWIVNTYYFRKIVRRLANVEALGIRYNDYYSTMDLSALATLPRLTSLKLEVNHCSRTVLRLLNTVAKLSTLRELEISSAEVEYIHFIDATLLQNRVPRIVKSLVNLEKLTVDSSILDASTVLQIVQWAKKLKYFEVIGNHNYLISLSLVSMTLEACKTYRNRGDVLRLSCDPYYFNWMPRAKDMEHYLKIFVSSQNGKRTSNAYIHK